MDFFKFHFNQSPKLHNEENWIEIDNFIEVLSKNRSEVDIFKFRRGNVLRTFRGFQEGIQEIDGKQCVSISGILRYIFTYSKNVNICTVLSKAVEQVILNTPRKDDSAPQGFYTSDKNAAKTCPEGEIELSEDFRRKLTKFYDDSQLCDVTLVADGRRFPCHKLVLSVWSDYFHAMFQIKQEGAPQTEVKVRGVTCRDLATLIRCMYTWKLTLNKDNVCGLLRAAHVLSVHPVRRLCAAFMKRHPHPDYLTTAQSCHLEDVVNVIKKSAHVHSVPLIKSSSGNHVKSKTDNQKDVPDTQEPFDPFQNKAATLHDSINNSALQTAQNTITDLFAEEKICRENDCKEELIKETDISYVTPSVNAADIKCSPSLSLQQYEKENVGTIVKQFSADEDITKTTQVPQFSCKRCKMQFQDSHSLKRHAATHTYPCGHCPKVFSYKQHLNRHYKNKHCPQNSLVPKYAGTCVLCGKVFQSKYGFENHAMKCSGGKTYPCSQCYKVFKFEKNLEKHLSTCSKYKYQCTLCSKYFKSRQGFNYHMNITHRGEKQHGCQKCGKKYTVKSYLKYHMLSVHSEGRKSLCGICGKYYRSDISLKMHQRTQHHQGDPVTCEVCQKVFHHKYRLNMHMKTHSEAMFACDRCGKMLKSMSGLTEHLRIHTQDNLYVCEICHKKFTCKSSLTQHHRIHTGEKRHACNVCGKRFIHSGSLSKHRTIHQK